MVAIKTEFMFSSFKNSFSTHFLLKKSRKHYKNLVKPIPQKCKNKKRNTLELEINIKLKKILLARI